MAVPRRPYGCPGKSSPRGNGDADEFDVWHEGRKDRCVLEKKRRGGTHEGCCCDVRARDESPAAVRVLCREKGEGDGPLVEYLPRRAVFRVNALGAAMTDRTPLDDVTEMGAFECGTRLGTVCSAALELVVEGRGWGGGKAYS